MRNVSSCDVQKVTNVCRYLGISWWKNTKKNAMANVKRQKTFLEKCDLELSTINRVKPIRTNVGSGVMKMRFTTIPPCFSFTLLFFLLPAWDWYFRQTITGKKLHK